MDGVLRLPPIQRYHKGGKQQRIIKSIRPPGKDRRRRAGQRHYHQPEISQPDLLNRQANGKLQDQVDAHLQGSGGAEKSDVRDRRQPQMDNAEENQDGPCRQAEFRTDGDKTGDIRHNHGE